MKRWRRTGRVIVEFFRLLIAGGRYFADYAYLRKKVKVLLAAKRYMPSTILCLTRKFSVGLLEIKIYVNNLLLVY